MLARMVRIIKNNLTKHCLNFCTKNTTKKNHLFVCLLFGVIATQRIVLEHFKWNSTMKSEIARGNFIPWLMRLLVVGQMPIL